MTYPTMQQTTTTMRMPTYPSNSYDYATTDGAVYTQQQHQTAPMHKEHPYTQQQTQPQEVPGPIPTDSCESEPNSNNNYQPAPPPTSEAAAPVTMHAQQQPQPQQMIIHHPPPNVTALPPQPNQNKLRANRTGRWSLDEKILFLYGLRKFGKGRWKKISIYLPNRSLVQIKSHAQKVLKRQEEGENIFRRLEDNAARMDHLVAEAHKRMETVPNGDGNTFSPSHSGNASADSATARMAKRKRQPILDPNQHHHQPHHIYAPPGAPPPPPPPPHHHHLHPGYHPHPHYEAWPPHPHHMVPQPPPPHLLHHHYHPHQGPPPPHHHPMGGQHHPHYHGPPVPAQHHSQQQPPPPPPKPQEQQYHAQPQPAQEASSAAPPLVTAYPIKQEEKVSDSQKATENCDPSANGDGGSNNNSNSDSNNNGGKVEDFIAASALCQLGVFNDNSNGNASSVNNPVLATESETAVTDVPTTSI